MGARGRLLGIDALRFVAASLVLLTHTSVPWDSAPRWAAPLHWVAADGGTGVTLFLVLSGFSIHLRWASRGDEAGAFPVVAFWRRRFLRLYPTFWLAVPVCIALTVAAEGVTRFTQTPRGWGWVPGDMPVAVQVVAFALLVPANVIPLAHFGRAWSLGLEEQLYALYSAGQRWRRGWLRPGRVVVVTSALAVLFPLAAMVARPGWVPFADGATPREQLLLVQVPALALPWALGYALAEQRAGRYRLPRALTSPAFGLVLLAVLVVVRHVSDPVLHLGAGRTLAPYDVLAQALFAVGFAAVVAGAALDGPGSIGRLVPAKAVRLLARGGLWSYSLYLIHPPVLELVDRRGHLSTGPRVLVGWAAALLVSWLFYLLVERRWLRRAQQARLPEPTAPYQREPGPDEHSISDRVSPMPRFERPIGNAGRD
jgi:peptidoglycan/LPS O-acetylase OafA/YrhL